MGLVADIRFQRASYLPVSLNLKPFILLLCACLMGCGYEPEIREYTVPRKKKAAASAQTSVAQRLLAAIVPKDQGAWGLKVLGEPAVIKPIEEEFHKLIETMTFAADGNPIWKLPGSWRQAPGDNFNFAVIYPTTENQPRITISKLSVPDPLTEAAWRDFVLQNVNRWRGQVQLPLQQQFEQILGALQPVTALSQPPLVAYYLALEGTSPGGNRPFSMAGKQKIGEAASPPAKVNYQVPQGWQDQSQPGGMRMASFKIEVDGKSADISIIAAGGNEPDNIARWQKQLVPNAEDARVRSVMDSAQPITVNEIPSKIYFMTNDSLDAKEAILGAIVPWHTTNSLFVKLTGPASIAEANRKQFEELVTSLKW